MRFEPEERWDRLFEPMEPGTRRAVRARLLAAVRNDAVVVRARRLSLAAVALATTVALGGGAVAYGAGRSVPGSPLFAVKIALEETAIATAPTGAVKERLLAQAAVSRVAEVAALSQAGADDSRVDAAVTLFGSAARRAVEDGRKSARRRIERSVERVPEPARGSVEKALREASKDRGSEDARPTAERPRGDAGKAPSPEDGDEARPGKARRSPGKAEGKAKRK